MVYGLHALYGLYVGVGSLNNHFCGIIPYLTYSRLHIEIGRYAESVMLHLHDECIFIWNT